MWKHVSITQAEKKLCLAYKENNIDGTKTWILIEVRNDDRFIQLVAVNQMTEFTFLH